MTTKIRKTSATCLLCCNIVAASLLTACSDWTDHYDADSELLSTQHQTLWENIATNPSLTQFAELLKKGGYDQVLSASQTYTVWAPADGTFDYNRLSAYSSSRLKQEFIDNHIARNNYQALGTQPKRIYTLNEKMMNFGRNAAGQFAIQDVAISKPNVAGLNGTIHTLDGIIPFRANIYESLNNLDYPIDSVADFYHSFDERKLDESKSVQGPMLNGEITYLDSIFTERNDLYGLYNAYINQEDSNYTMIVPTNEAWSKATAQLSQYFHYLPSFDFKDYELDRTTTITLSDIDSLTNATIKHNLMRELFYNSNIYDNKKLNALQTGQTLNCDSLYSTTYTKLYTEDAARLFEGATRVDKSNGALWVTDSLRVRPWNSWNPELIIQAESHASYTENVTTDGAQRIYVTPGTQNPEVSGHVSNNSYLDLPPLGSSTNPKVYFRLPNVRSTTYSIYVVTVPANITSSNFKSKPYHFNASMEYVEETGKNTVKAAKDWTVSSTFDSDTLSVDTIYIGDFTFPVSYYGTGNYFPYLRLESRVSSSLRDTYDRNLRFDCIILRPKDLDDYLKAHPDYKYDRGNY